MRRGFKSQCESVTAAVRAEIGLDTRSPLDPRRLADHLGIRLYPLSSLKGDDVAAAIAHVQKGAPSILSAITIFPDWPLPHRVIIYNDMNSDGRQNSDLAHELAHGLLLHEPRPAIVNGCRQYDATEEDEAAWLSGCLLVPRDAAVIVATSGQPIHLEAQRFGVSTKMMEWRVNSTGARRQANAARRRRT